MDETSRAMKEGEDVEHYIPMMGDPKSTEGVASGVLSSKHKDDDCEHSGKESSKSCHSKEHPVGELGQDVGAMIDLSKDASQIVGSLGGNVVEVEAVTNRMHECEKQSC